MRNDFIVNYFMNYVTVGNIIQTEINQQQTLKEHTESSPMTGEQVES